MANHCFLLTCWTYPRWGPSGVGEMSRLEKLDGYENTLVTKLLAIVTISWYFHAAYCTHQRGERKWHFSFRLFQKIWFWLEKWESWQKLAQEVDEENIAICQKYLKRLVPRAVICEAQMRVGQRGRPHIYAINIFSTWIIYRILWSFWHFLEVIPKSFLQKQNISFLKSPGLPARSAIWWYFITSKSQPIAG